MNITILYHTRTGNTRTLAEHIARIIAEDGHNATIKSITEVASHDVETADLLFIGTWVHGLILFNVRPANADMWVRSLPSLENKPVASFCTYAFNPRKSLTILNNLLAERGARVIEHQAFHRNRLDEGLESFVQQAIASV